MSRKISDEYQKTTLNFIGLESGVIYVNTRNTEAIVGCVGGTIKVCGVGVGYGPGVVPPGGSVEVTRNEGLYNQFSAIMEWPSVRAAICAESTVKHWTEITDKEPSFLDLKLRDALIMAGHTIIEDKGPYILASREPRRSFIRTVGSIAWRLLIVMVVVGVTVVVLAGARA